MLSNFELKIILRLLYHSNKHNFISVINILALLGTALGVMTLIIVMSVMNGYESQFMKKISGVNGDYTITTPKHEIEKYNEAVDKLQDLSFVKYAAPILNGQAIVQHQKKVTGVMVKGVDEKLFFKKPIIMQSCINCENIKPSSFSNDHIYIGTTLADSLEVKVGDQIKLMTPKIKRTLIGSIARMKTFEIAGILDLGWHEYNAGIVYINMNVAQKLFIDGNFASEIEVVTFNHKNKSQQIAMMQNTLATVTKDNIVVSDWLSSNKSFMDALKVERNTMFFILMLIILIAAFNIVSGLTMLIKEKFKTIAILRALGASRLSIIKIFISVGFLLGLVGTIAGTILGVLFVNNINLIKNFLEYYLDITLFDPVIYLLTYLPSEPKVNEIVSIIVTAMTLSLLATIYPSWLAANQQPDEALRHE